MDGLRECLKRIICFQGDIRAALCLSGAVPLTHVLEPHLVNVEEELRRRIVENALLLRKEMFLLSKGSGSKEKRDEYFRNRMRMYPTGCSRESTYFTCHKEPFEPPPIRGPSPSTSPRTKTRRGSGSSTSTCPRSTTTGCSASRP